MSIQRVKTREVTIGSVAIGGTHPIQVQSMTSTKTEDASATIAQCLRLEEAGCEMVRVTVPNETALRNIAAIRAAIKIPLVADIHFRQDLALGLMETPVDKIRLNPGNIGGPEKFREVVRKAKQHNKAIRIGINSGSLEKELLEKYGHPTAEALVESALRGVAICDEEGYRQVVVSIKSSDTTEALLAARLFAKQSDVPQHIGITEAGTVRYGTIKSAVGLGAMLLDGIGDTIRVSLTGDPVAEIPVAFDILKAARRRIITPELVACPTCGRIQIDLIAIADKVEAFLKTVKKPIRVSVLGCVVNGPGEAKESDIGIAGGAGYAILYRRGEKIREVPEAQILDALREEIERL